MHTCACMYAGWDFYLLCKISSLIRTKAFGNYLEHKGEGAYTSSWVHICVHCSLLLIRVNVNALFTTQK